MGVGVPDFREGKVEKKMNLYNLVTDCRTVLNFWKRKWLSLYIYHFSSAIDFSSEKYMVSTGHRCSWCQ